MGMPTLIIPILKVFFKKISDKEIDAGAALKSNPSSYRYRLTVNGIGQQNLAPNFEKGFEKVNFIKLFLFVIDANDE
jgi:hypothetical protein